MLKTARGVSGGGERKGEHVGERVDERRPHERAGGASWGASGRANNSTSLVLPGDNSYSQPVPKLLYTYYTTQEYWYKVVVIRNPCNFEGGPTPWGRMKGSHEGVAHTHVRTYVRMHARTFMCMYARTFTCMFRNKVTFKVTFYIKGNLISVRP